VTISPSRFVGVFAAAVVAAAGTFVCPADPPAPPAFDPDPPEKLADYRTVQQAISAELGVGSTRRPFILGIHCVPDEKTGRPVVAAVLPGSPAAEARIFVGDLVIEFNGVAPVSPAELSELVRSVDRFGKVELTVRRGEFTLKKHPADAERPAVVDSAGPVIPPAALGAVFGKAADGSIAVTTVDAGSPAEKAGFAVGDRVMKFQGAPVEGLPSLVLAIAGSRPAEPLVFELRRGGAESTVRVTLPVRAISNPAAPPAKAVKRFRLAVAGIEFNDAARNAEWSAADWEDMLFSRGKYVRGSPSGSPVRGSAADYFAEQSIGEFTLTGKFLGWFKLPGRKADWAVQSQAYSEFPRTAAELVRVKSGHDLTAEFDGLCFVTAGLLAGKPGSALWPHQSRTAVEGRPLPYIVIFEDGRTFPSISVVVHEIGHLLGLPDQYAASADANLGLWCSMAMGHKGHDGARGAMPNHLCAWCKLRLGWLRPVPIDPSVPQHLQLRAVSAAANECFQVLLQPNGTEYLLLENRARRGFDAELPAEGLLVWRVTDYTKVEIEPAHGLRSGELSLRFPHLVPFPQTGRTAITPRTVPSGRARTPFGRDVSIVDIRRHAGGEITFTIGVDFF
jgi:M6 family metalloprotease-like protein